MKYSGLDILSINQILLSSKESKGSLAKQLLVFCGQLYYYTFLHRFKYKTLPENYQGIAFVGFSKNNQRSIAPIIKKMPEGDYLSLDNHKVDVNKRKAWWASIPYLFALLRTYRKSDAEARNCIKRFFVEFWTTYGLYPLAKEYLIHYKIKTLVLSNDHNTLNRCLIIHAKSMGIKTIYVQHASVTAKFPQLLFDYSFLDGEETLEKYLCVGQPIGNVYLSGGVRFDAYTKKQKNDNLPYARTIGIAINMVDNFEKVKSLCHFLAHDFELILRPHPRYGAIDQNWLKENGILYSDPIDESPSDFINRIDCLISNQSAIHLDAAIMNCPSIVFNFSDIDINDYYSYVSNGLVKEAFDYNELKSFLNKPSQLLPTNSIVQYYNASHDTPLEGHLGEIIAQYIQTINSKNEIESDDVFCQDAKRPQIFLIKN